MSSDRPIRRVIAVAPMPPEKSAYALARYSRSPDSIEKSIAWVHGHSSEKFWEQFYFDYGHASIADQIIPKRIGSFKNMIFKGKKLSSFNKH